MLMSHLLTFFGRGPGNEYPLKTNEFYTQSSCYIIQDDTEYIEDRTSINIPDFGQNWLPLGLTKVSTLLRLEIRDKISFNLEKSRLGPKARPPGQSPVQRIF